ncbi:MAG: type VI secretion system tip protein TssI/VgrG [Pseudomonadota bacterium]
MSEAPQTLQQMIRGRQHDRILRLSFPQGDGPSAQLLVNRLDAFEALSRPFEFTVELLSNDPNLELKALQGKQLCVELVRRDGTLRYFCGHVFSFSLKTVDGNVSYYEAKLGPWYKYLEMRKDNYLFHYTTLYQQTSSIFGDYGGLADWEWRVRSGDEVMTDSCQYGESDSNYLERKWVAAGIVYWFEHGPGGHRMVLSDDTTSVPPIDGNIEIPFQRHAGAFEEDGIGEWSPSRQVTEGSVALASYDFKSARPAVTTLPTLNKQGAVPDIESYEYTGALGFKNGDAGRSLAQLRMEEMEAAGKQFTGAGNNRQAMPGRWFRLSGHFDTSGSGADKQAREFLITEVRHSVSNNYHVSATAPSRYENTLTCIRKIIPWRAGRDHNSVETKIHGIQTATVVGPKGEEIHTDKYGRVRVQFHWDRAGGNDEKSSAWIRVATPWAGSNFGMTSIPRIGTEVLIQFIDGSPDRPIITGMVPNANTMPPWTLPDNKTQSGVLTRSTPGGRYDNANALRFEDKKGAEQLWLHAEKDQLTEVEHDEDKWVGNDRRKTVDRDETNHIKRDRTETVDRDETITVHGKRTEIVDGNEDITIHSNRTELVNLDEKITVNQNRSERVDLNETISVGKSRKRDVADNETIDIGKNRNKSVGKNESDSIGNNWSIKVGKIKTETIGMAHIENIGLARMTNIGMAYSLIVGMIRNTAIGMVDRLTVGKSRTVSIGETQDVTIGQTETRKIGQTHITTVGEHLELACGNAKIVLRSDGSIFLQGTNIEIQGSAHINADSGLVQINCGAAKAPPPPPETESKEETTQASGAGAASTDLSGLLGGGNIFSTLGKLTGMASTLGIGGKGVAAASKLMGVMDSSGSQPIQQSSRTASQDAGPDKI